MKLNTYWIAIPPACMTPARDEYMHLAPAWDAHALFGGYERSWNGRAYGMEGREQYLETKAILERGDEQPA
ncbi:protein of unknown function (plasmid) [Cupriavidus taiwanensis]|uniref:Uncharacterized protein n=1 Tax=Cupriavidus taiwanensis TaxID=164546 RepID=A0A375ISC9_9BURK|nr:hypothetical protein [Cupriavidus taiwanensis]SOY67038.1 hypothetical protein CBM2592_B150030 [Cupriavidus taiwanensis]SOY67105.1 hypothetical protein CBM2588_B190030 [Cupriavidus taiwanensis]SOY94785.1 hypothetical protein CBM2591_B140031 [Cupriavidus taiwanensis]SOZ71680.1 hypothetical protein CBM2617_B180033 [Cupriavidus taiwanensis]SOZ86908.1 hypothetical protein CBM2618_B200033 [Cupriavidus taiwanensis]